MSDNTDKVVVRFHARHIPDGPVWFVNNRRFGINVVGVNLTEAIIKMNSALMDYLNSAENTSGTNLKLENMQIDVMFHAPVPIPLDVVNQLFVSIVQPEPTSQDDLRDKHLQIFHKMLKESDSTPTNTTPDQ